MCASTNGCLALWKRTGSSLYWNHPNHIPCCHQALNIANYSCHSSVEPGNLGNNFGLLSSWLLQVGKGVPTARMGSYFISIQNANRVTHYVTGDVTLSSLATGYIKLTLLPINTATVMWYLIRSHAAARESHLGPWGCSLMMVGQDSLKKQFFLLSTLLSTSYSL